MSVVDPTPRNSRTSQTPSLFSWIRRSRTESVYDGEAQLAAARRAADPFADEMKVVDLNEKIEYGSANPFVDQQSLPPSLVAGPGQGHPEQLRW